MARVSASSDRPATSFAAPASTINEKAAQLSDSRQLNGGSLEDVIRVRGARQHNLKNVDLTIPRKR